MRAIVLGFVLAALAGSAPLSIAWGAAPAWKAPRNGMGQPDLEGAWTNATMTPQTRPTEYGARRAMTTDEVAKIEGAAP